MSLPSVEVLQQFDIQGKLAKVEPLGEGNINQSFVSVWKSAGGDRRYVHQSINRHVFTDIELVMHNIQLVTQHVRSKIISLDEGECALELIEARQGGFLVKEASGAVWRTYKYIDNSYTIQSAASSAQAYEAGLAFGRFQHHLADLSPDLIRSPIPFFQNIPVRIKALKDALQRDTAGRKKSAAAEAAALLEHEERAALIERGLLAGRIPVRVTHADPKINNVLFSTATGSAIAIVDLDTCMPGTILYDFGDFTRSSAVSCREDEQDLRKVEINLELFDALSRGYLKHLAQDLTRAEIELLHIAPSLLALSLAARFLTDYLNGDAYFRVAYAEHNLVRCRTQSKILKSMLKKEAKMKGIIEKYSEQ